MTIDNDVLTLSELCELARPHTLESYSPLAERHCLSVDLRNSGLALSSDEHRVIGTWLQQLPSPAIAIGTEHPLAAAFDIAVQSPQDLTAVYNNIEQAPIAAMTLVQTLRTTMALPADAALLIESLAYATLQAGSEFKRWSQANPPKFVTMNADTAPLLITRNDDDLQVDLNRPERRNAISAEMRDALTQLFQFIAEDDSLKKITIAGNGSCFSIGGDIDEFGTVPDAATAHAIRSQRLPAKYLLLCAERVAFHVHSACIGAGIEIPAFGAHISAKRNAFFQLPEIRFGLIPGAGGCVSIPRRIGRQRTAYMALSAKKINAVTALEWGLIDEIVDH